MFCRRWGVPLIDGGTVRLLRIIGQGWALDMILTGRPLVAEETLAIGLANRVVAASERGAHRRAIIRGGNSSLPSDVPEDRPDVCLSAMGF